MLEALPPRVQAEASKPIKSRLSLKKRKYLKLLESNPVRDLNPKELKDK